MNPVIWTVIASLVIGYSLHRYLHQRKYPDGTPVITSGQHTLINVIHGVTVALQGLALHIASGDGNASSAGVFMSFMVVIFQSIAMGIACAVVDDEHKDHRKEHPANSQTDDEPAPSNE